MEYARVQRTLTLILILNIGVAIAKAAFGLLAGSVSMVADALHSTFDSVSNIVGILSTTIAKQPADKAHPYGHGKFETLGTLVIGAMLLLSAYWIITEGFNRLRSSATPDVTGITVTVLLATILVNTFVAWYERKVGLELNSQILIADAAHTRSDIFVSISVLAGFGAVSLGYPQADPLIAFGIGILIGKMGLSIIKEAGDVLTDRAVIDCEEEIKRTLSKIEGVRGYHQFRCRGKPMELFADIHVLVDPAITVRDGHDIAEAVRRRILEEVDGMQDIVVHIDPVDEYEEEG
jgi:cation diffusion facilitator family transporter